VGTIFQKTRRLLFCFSVRPRKCIFGTPRHPHWQPQNRSPAGHWRLSGWRGDGGHEARIG